MPKEPLYPFCRVYTETLPQHIVNAIQDIQRKASEWDLAEARGMASGAKRRTPSQRFIDSPLWRKARDSARKLYGSVCHKCGSSSNVQVDHIKPRSKYPELALDIDNLQILCWPCNKEKSNRHETDYRGMS